MIEVKNISKSFGDQLIVDDVSTTFEEGKTNLIIGQSGSGKTVLMKCCIGLYDVDSGEVNFHGRRFSNIPDKKRKNIRHAELDSASPHNVWDSVYSQNVRRTL